MSAQGYTLPATAVCPGCSRLVVLPAEPLYPDTPPAICATCDTEIPDYRRESYLPDASLPSTIAEPVQKTPLEDRRYTRKGLFKSLSGALAERGVTVVESAKDRFGN